METEVQAPRSCSFCHRGGSEWRSVGLTFPMGRGEKIGRGFLRVCLDCRGRATMALAAISLAFVGIAAYLPVTRAVGLDAAQRKAGLLFAVPALLAVVCVAGLFLGGPTAKRAVWRLRCARLGTCYAGTRERRRAVRSAFVLAVALTLAVPLGVLGIVSAGSMVSSGRNAADYTVVTKRLGTVVGTRAATTSDVDPLPGPVMVAGAAGYFFAIMLGWRRALRKQAQPTVDVAARLNDLFPSGLTVHNDKELTWPAKGLTEAFHRWGESS